MSAAVQLKDRGIRLAVGFFDGVHLGHRRILAGTDAVLTFRNHPMSVLDPARAPALLMDVDERISMLRTVGARRPRAVHAVEFTKSFASMTPEDFVSYLRREFPNLERVHCGGNWRFGANGAVCWLPHTPHSDALGLRPAVTQVLSHCTSKGSPWC